MSIASTVTATVSSTPDAAARPQLRRAQLKLYDAKPGRKGTVELGAFRGSIDFHFNPKELSLTKSATWKRNDQKDAETASTAEFTGAGPSKLSVEMFLDETEKRDGSVAKAVEQLLACCTPTKESQRRDLPSPPVVRFHWGNLTGFPAFVSQVSAKYTLFTIEGTPLRATCSLSLEELASEPGGQNPTSGALAVRRHHVVVDGDSLASLAYQEYDDPGRWRALAEYNGIDDPLRLPPGTELLVPAVEDLARGRG